MTKNRPTADEAASVGGTRLGRAVGAVLTVALLAPAAAVLTSRLRGLIDLEVGLGAQCGGIDALGPALRTSLPVVFLADHPVTGGYPVIGVVVAADIGRAAQAQPGQQLRFEIEGSVRRG